MVPLRAVRPGYRVVRLRDKFGSRLTLARLLVHIEMAWTVLPPLSLRQAYSESEQHKDVRQMGVLRGGGDQVRVRARVRVTVTVTVTVS